MNQVIPHTKAAEMAAIYQRNKTRILELLLEVNQLTAEMRSVFFGTLGSTLFNFPGAEYSEPKIEELARQLKRDAWGAMLRKLEIHKYMSSSKQEALSHLLSGSHRADDDPIDELPDITEENIFSVMQGYMQCVPDFMDEAIREEWDYWLPRRDQYRTNVERWKVSKKIVMTYVMQRWDQFSHCHRVNYRATKHVNNLDSIFHLLDGRGFPKEYNGPLHNALDGNKTGSGETEYFKFRCWKNGNLHLTIKRLDLLQKFNEIGCGNGTSLPNPTEKGSWQPEVAPLEGKRPAAETFAQLDFFPTPPDVVQLMLAKVDRHFECGYYSKLTVMEPSAGEGAIVQAIQRKEPKRLYVFEYDRERCRELEQRYRDIWLQQADFLAVEPFPAMDAVLMNPPFSGTRDIWHVYHAYKFLKPGGILVAVMSPHFDFAEDKLSRDFRKFLGSVNHEWKLLEPGSFKSSGTSVQTGLLTIRRSTQRVSVGLAVLTSAAAE